MKMSGLLIYLGHPVGTVHTTMGNIPLLLNHIIFITNKGQVDGGGGGMYGSGEYHRD
jgi:hypothetical protein